MLNLNQKLMLEMPHLKLSYSLFCRKRPFWIVAPNINNRETCVCKLHDNAQMKADRLKHLGIIKSPSLSKVAEELCCDTQAKACMYRECLSCKNKSLLNTTSTGTSEVTWWYQWLTKKEDYEKEKDGERPKITVTKTVKQRCEGSPEHLFNILHQYTQLQFLHKSLKEDEAIIHIDYAENWQCKYAKEVQQVHVGASHRQTTLHNAVVYTTDGTLTFCALSPSMKHDPPAIWAQLEPVLQFLKENHARIKKLFFISDGRTMQYRGKKNFFLLSTIPFRMGFTAVNWSFLEAGHGKGLADGVGATMKRTADSQVARGTDIPTAKALYDTLSSHKSQALLRGGRRDEQIDDITKDLLGKWCVITYDDNPHPGIIADMAEGGLEVKVMHYIGRNRFFWPRLEDKIWYTVDKVVTLIPPPENLTQRHVQISPRVFAAVCKQLNL
ncbi:hypothetical protein JOQ06_026706 [Pogonophryne albipinna]|uniref:Uncharacterized protein n=1 Tax=Pogonophryne albipinna TaxID=1090488 RepID=A0AAD6FMA2_9TELE|nr:hypothetical protein JOQ06_026706 [Pogonophryne albipinna]